MRIRNWAIHSQRDSVSVFFSHSNNAKTAKNELTSSIFILPRGTYLGWLCEGLEKFGEDLVLGHFAADEFGVVFGSVDSAQIGDRDFSSVVYSRVEKTLKTSDGEKEWSPFPLSNFWNALRTRSFRHCLIGCLSVQSMSSKSTKPEPFRSKIVNNSATSSFVNSHPNSLNPFPNS